MGGMRSLIVFVLVFGLGLGRPTMVRAQDAAIRDTISVGGRTREYIVYRDARSDPVRPAPLVLFFHGGGGSATGAMARYGFDAVAGAAGAIVVYPEGINGHWADGRSIFHDADDVAFTRALVARLRERFRVDPRRIFAVGHSNGAIFVNTVACRVPGLFVAIGAVSGTIPVNDARTCLATGPLSVIEIHGTDDPLTPYAGGAVGQNRGFITDAEGSIGEWGRIDGCKSPPVRTALPPRVSTDPTRVVTVEFLGCRAGRAAILYAIQGAGHDWPGAAGHLPEVAVGPTSRQLDATRVIWDFFVAHPAP